MREAVRARLAALEPDRHAQIRSRAARTLAEALGHAAPRERWRFAADLLFLVPYPEVRSAFFPPEVPLPSVDLAAREDAAALDAMARRKGAEVARMAVLWRQALPHRVWVARDGRGGPLAFYVFARSEDALAPLAAEDELLAAWLGHHHASDRRGASIFLRAMAEVEGADGAAGRAACILDLKRAYIERRELRRVYATADDEVLADPVLRQLGFQPQNLSGRRPDTLLLDMGARGFDSWIAGLAGLEPSEPAPRRGELCLDRASRELRIGEHQATLTRLETAVLAALIDAAPDPIAREVLIETIWRRVVVGSNVVDAVVRTLRTKLGPHRDRVQTIPGLGYRLAPASPEQAAS